MSLSPYGPPATPRDARPAVIFWFRLFATFMGAAYLGVGVFGGLSRSTPMLALGVLLAALYGVAALVPYKPWGWTLALVAIGLAAASGAVVVCVPLLIHWMRPTTRAAFGRL